MICAAQAFGGCCVGVMFFGVQSKVWPYKNSSDNWLKLCAELQLFMTLVLSIVLRTTLGKDFLTADGYGVLLVATFFCSPSVA